MKRQFILFFIMLLWNSVGAQYTIIPDPNFEQFLEDNGMGDGIVGNGQVLTANIENITEMIIPPYDISDLTGIQDFVSLEVFSCALNPVTEINLSQNTHIKMLGFLRMFMLNNVDVSMLHELEELHLYQNLFNSISLGFHPNLRVVDVSENSLASIDVSQCPALEELNIKENGIHNLDLSHNPNLWFLYTSLNPLSSLDTTNNPNLEVYYGGDDFISELDFSQNPVLRMLSVSLGHNLSQIDMRNGNNEIIEYFYISQCPELTCIFVDDASAPYLEDWVVYEEDAHFVNNEDECAALQTEDVISQKIRLYPNPVSNKLNILNPDLSITSVQISDTSGKIIFGQKTTSPIIEIDFSHFPKGIYFISAEENGKVLKTSKIIKK